MLSALGLLDQLWAELASTAVKMATAKHLSKEEGSWRAGLGSWVESVADFCQWKQETNDCVRGIDSHMVQYVFCEVM